MPAHLALATSGLLGPSVLNHAKRLAGIAPPTGPSTPCVLRGSLLRLTRLTRPECDALLTGRLPVLPASVGFEPGLCTDDCSSCCAFGATGIIHTRVWATRHEFTVLPVGYSCNLSQLPDCLSPAFGWLPDLFSEHSYNSRFTPLRLSASEVVLCRIFWMRSRVVFPAVL